MIENVLKLLRSLATSGHSVGHGESLSGFCPVCCAYPRGHRLGCELGSAIAQLEGGEVWPTPIPVAERLPRDAEGVLLFTHSWLMGSLVLGGPSKPPYFVDHRTGEAIEPTHWLPLPPAP